MDLQYLIIGIAIMAGVTYVIRMIPMVLFREKIENVWVKSFLHYVPYVVLAAMTFPAIFESTQSQISAIAGCVAGIGLAYFNKGLLVVALGSSGIVLIMGLLGL